MCPVIFFVFLNYYIVFHYFNKHENNYRNSKIMELVRLTHARSIGFWWRPIYEIFSLIDWLIVMLDWFASLYDMYAIIMYLCTNLVSYDNTQLVIKVHLVLDCVYLFTCYHACFAFTSLIIVRYPQLINQLSRLFHLISIDLF